MELTSNHHVRWTKGLVTLPARVTCLQLEEYVALYLRFEEDHYRVEIRKLNDVHEWKYSGFHHHSNANTRRDNKVVGS